MYMHILCLTFFILTSLWFTCFGKVYVCFSCQQRFF
jgi:hypothetical protein